MGQILSFHPPKDGLLKFYEVVGEDGRAVWGGEQESEAVLWFRKTIGGRLLVQAWQADEDDAHPVGQPIDLTKLVKALIVEVVG